MNTLKNELLNRSISVLDYKRRRLSLVNNNLPVKMLGQTNVSEIIDRLNEIQLPPSVSRGFMYMSELWINGDFVKEKTELQEIMAPVLHNIRYATSVLLKHETRIIKCVIGTIDENSCVLPHSDDFFHHQLALRIHIPLQTSNGSIGINWHPVTLEPFLWRMGKIGRMYAFNNFEPHTVTKLDHGTRAHLIVDLVVKDLFANLGDPTVLNDILFKRDEHHEHSTNFITHTNSNFLTRNRLNEMYGLPPLKTINEQMEEPNVQLNRQWIQELATLKIPRVF